MEVWGIVLQAKLWNGGTLMEGQLNLSIQKTLKNIVLYFLLFLAGDFINSLVWDLFFSVVELPYRELYSVLRMSGQLFFTCLFFWIYTIKVLHLKMRSFGISFDIKPWGVLFSVLLPAFVVLAFLLIGNGYVNSFAVSDAILIVISSILTALKAGIIEEMLFRGFIMKLLENRWNKFVAIFAPSFLFSLLHIPSMETFSVAGVMLLIVSGTLVGIMFSLVAYKGNSISNSAIIHTVWNLVMVTGILHITTEQGYYGNPIFSIIIPFDNALLTGAGFGAEASIIAIVGYACICAVVLLSKNSKGLFIAGETK
mgnify:CR=1 FL=1